MTPEVTFGTELEVDFTTPNQVRAGTTHYLETLDQDKWGTCPEIHPHTLEIQTKGAPTLSEGLQHILRALEATRLQTNDLLMQPFGNLPHPYTPEEYDNFIHFIEKHEDPYYQYLAFKRDGSAIRNLDVCGAQFHVGNEHPEALIRRYNFLRPILPFFQAMAASSPIREGTYKGHYSERVRAKTHLPNFSIPPVITSLGVLEDLLRQAPDIQPSQAPGYYLLRFPRLDIGTTEMCASDMTPDLKAIMAMADVYHRLCRKIDTTKDEDLPSDLFGFAPLDPASQIYIQRSLDTINGTNKSPKDHFISLGAGQHTPFSQWVNTLLDFIKDTPPEHGLPGFSSEDEVCRILEDGTVAEIIIKRLLEEGLISPEDKFGYQKQFSSEALAEIYKIYQNITDKKFKSQIAGLIT